MTPEPREFTVYGFDSTHDALSAERLLVDMGVTVTAIPSPSELGSLCGVALRIEPRDADRAERFLTASGLLWTGRTAVQDV
jgi:hypothetical protein